MRGAVLLAALCLPSSAAAAGKPRGALRELVVGVSSKQNPPLAFQSPGGEWRGISIDLWKRVAEELKLPYRIKVYEGSTMRSADGKRFLPFKDNGLDVHIGVVIDYDTEEFNDATAPYMLTGLSIATRPDPRGGLADFTRRLLTPEFIEGAGLLMLAPMLMGLIIWRMERRKNKREFGGPQTRGLAAAVLWACESMVGKARPILRTWPARVLTIGWTFCCIMFVSAATAKLSSELTINQIHTRVSGPRDLVNVRVGTVKAGAGWIYLSKRGVPFTRYDTNAALVDALAKGEIDAAVSSEFQLRYFISKQPSGSLVMLPGTFTTYGVGFGVNQGSPLRLKLNQALLKIVESDDWKQVVASYFEGKP